MRSIGETLKRKVSEVPLPVSDPVGLTIDKAVDVYVANRGESTGPLEIKNPHGKWKPLSNEGVVEEIEEHIRTRVRTNSRLDSPTGITGMAVISHKGTPRFSWSMDVAVREFTILGDGTAVHAPEEGWRFTQKKGRSRNIAHLEIRQRRERSHRRDKGNEPAKIPSGVS